MEDETPSSAIGSCEEPAGRPIPQHPDALLHTIEAAFLLGLSHRTLETMRLRGDGPPFIAVTMRAVRYRRQDLIAWIQARQRRSTSDQPLQGQRLDQKARQHNAS